MSPCDRMRTKIDYIIVKKRSKKIKLKLKTYPGVDMDNNHT